METSKEQTTGEQGKDGGATGEQKAVAVANGRDAPRGDGGAQKGTDSLGDQLFDPRTTRSASGRGKQAGFGINEGKNILVNKLRGPPVGSASGGSSLFVQDGQVFFGHHQEKPEKTGCGGGPPEDGGKPEKTGGSVSGENSTSEQPLANSRPKIAAPQELAADKGAEHEEIRAASAGAGQKMNPRGPSSQNRAAAAAPPSRQNPSRQNHPAPEQLSSSVGHLSSTAALLNPPSVLLPKSYNCYEAHPHVTTDFVRRKEHKLPLKKGVCVRIEGINARAEVAHGRQLPREILYNEENQWGGYGGASDVLPIQLCPLTVAGPPLHTLDVCTLMNPSTQRIKQEIMTGGPVVSTSFVLNSDFAAANGIAFEFEVFAVSSSTNDSCKTKNLDASTAAAARVVFPLLLTGWEVCWFGAAWIARTVVGGAQEGATQEVRIAFHQFSVDEQISFVPKERLQDIAWRSVLSPYLPLGGQGGSWTLLLGPEARECPSYDVGDEGKNLCPDSDSSLFPQIVAAMGSVSAVGSSAAATSATHRRSSCNTSGAEQDGPEADKVDKGDWGAAKSLVLTLGTALEDLHYFFGLVCDGRSGATQPMISTTTTSSTGGGIGAAILAKKQLELYDPSAGRSRSRAIALEEVCYDCGERVWRAVFTFVSVSPKKTGLTQAEVANSNRSRRSLGGA
eukprot:g12131.t1